MIESLGTPAVLIFIGAFISAAGAMWAAQRQAISEKELRQKSDEVAELNKQIALSITGGDSFAYLIPTRVAPNAAVLTLVHQGKYPLYDLHIRIVDLEKWAQHKHFSLLDVQKDEIHLSIGNVAANQARILGPMQINSDFTRWNIFFSARNGFC